LGVAPLHVVVVTGMSGAGRSTALHVLEDLGFFCVDNLPPALAPKLLDILGDGSELRRVGFGIDVRTGSFLEGAEAVLGGLRQRGCDVEVWFLDASDSALFRRFSETRRPHPMAPGGDVLAAIQLERERLSSLRAEATKIIDTTDQSVHELRRTLVDHIARGSHRFRMITRIVSFGFKYGTPVDADIVLDVRYLPNPHFVPELRPKTGLEDPVARFVIDTAEASELLADATQLLRHALPRFERDGKAYLTVAIGCTGGRHRSVAVSEELGRRLGDVSDVVVLHRDVQRPV